MKDKLLKDSLKVRIKDIEDCAYSYIKWLNDNTGDKMPLAISKNYLVKAHYHEEEGRGGYFAKESGTSEGQFLTLLGLLDIYEVTKNRDVLKLAKNIADSTLKYLYKNDEIPKEIFKEDYIFSPHWLFNASNDDFFSEKIYFHEKVSFINGVGFIKAKHKVKRLFSVRSLDSKLEWDSPFSKIIGKEYKVYDSVIKDNKITINLMENYSGILKVIYSDLGGEKVEPCENYEAYPVWRKLLKGESSCAVDSIWWSYQCFKKLYEILGDLKYKKILENMKGLIRFICKIENSNDYMSTDFQSNNPFSIEGTYTYDNRDREVKFSRDNLDGSVVIKILEGVGEVQFGKGGIDEIIPSDRYYKLKLSSLVKGKIKVILTDKNGYSKNRRWEKIIETRGNNEVEEILLYQNDFIRLDEKGKEEHLPKSIELKTIIISTDDIKEQILKIFYLRPMPLKSYPYTPWIFPFTLNTVNNKVSGEMGIPYVGYQAPWIWQELKEEEGVLECLRFIKDSQDAYKKITKTENNFFAPVFLWDVWNREDYGEKNTFAFNGPDPNATWGGYQYRAIEGVSKALYNNKELTLAKDIVYNFLKDINNIWSNYKDNLPTDFKESGMLLRSYYSSHDVALLLRTALYSLKSEVVDKDLCLSLINKCVLSLNHNFNKKGIIGLNKLSGTWATDNRWYMFWGGEILSSLALIIKFYKEENLY